MSIALRRVSVSNRSLEVADPIASWRRVIKGPGLRLRYDHRRRWKCPACGRKAKTRGSVVVKPCNCEGGETWMHLVKRPAPPPFPPPPAPTAVVAAEPETQDTSSAESETVTPETPLVEAAVTEAAVTEATVTEATVTEVPSSTICLHARRTAGRAQRVGGVGRGSRWQ